MYTTMKLHSFIIMLLCAVFFASCNKEDSYPTFSFDANGECYMPDVANISMEEFKSSVVGYGWKHVITHEIESNGKCTTKDYYEDLIGGGQANIILRHHHHSRNTCMQMLFRLTDIIHMPMIMRMVTESAKTAIW